MGKSQNIPDRDTQYATGEIERGYFEVVFEIPIDMMGNIERLLQNEFCKFNIKYDAGTEFYNKNIINLIEPCLIDNGIEYKKLSNQEIENLVRCNRVKKNDELCIWNKREYQTNAIDFSQQELAKKGKLYIKLPTGAGKSFIVYNLFEYLKSDFIVIVSPRKIVNSQNISQKYLQILSNNYILYNYSNDNNFDEYLKYPNNKIVICCTQSLNKIYEKLIINNITNITIWFDEAHWGVEKWLDTLNNDESSQFWLLNDTHIKYRIFTSASPNETIIEQNENIFGKLYLPIKIKELIDLNWLSGIKPYVYSEDIQNVDNIKYIISDFNDKKRKFGFSFHNKQQNAFNLFHKHYNEYKKGNTYIKPFLLISDDFTTEKESNLQEINLDYEYRNIKTFEKTIYSIGYVVAQYSMGYDFNKLDYICLSDPKLSIQDIIQSIGRGMRPDELGEYGSNKEKILILMLPVYINDNGDNSYEKIIEVLKYLLYDIEISFEDIDFENRYTPNLKEKGYSNEYIGINDVKSVLLNLLELDKKKIAVGTSYERARKIIADKNIKSKEEYYALCKNDNRLPKEPDIIYNGQFTNWIEYLNIERVYYDLNTCKNKVCDYLSYNPDINKQYLDLSFVCKKLCEFDNKFPPNGLWTEYYSVKDLSDIITIVIQKKKMGIV
jgi:superfamily II DNA or RNA helicase